MNTIIPPAPATTDAAEIESHLLRGYTLNVSHNQKRAELYWIHQL